MNEQEFKQIFDNGDKEEIKLAVEEMNKTYTITKIAEFAQRSTNSFRNYCNRIGVKPNRKLAQKHSVAHLINRQGGIK